jgi:hypothetical protein
MIGALTSYVAPQYHDDRLRAADRHRTVTGPRPRTARAIRPHSR